MRIEQLMSQPAITCGPTDTLNTAARLMWEHDCGAIPVVAADGKVVGIVTDRDVCMAAYTQGRPLQAIPVSRAMAKQVFSCRPDESVEDAERLMSEKQIRRVPIVDSDGQAIGLLSLNDIAREAGSARKKGLEREIVKTLAAVCQPRSRDIAARRPAAAQAAQARATAAT